MDLRRLEPPNPMIAILKVIEAGNGPDGFRARLMRDPIYLYPELAERGWGAEVLEETDALEIQAKPALKNILAVLKECDAGPEHIVRMTWFVTHKQKYLDKQKEVGAVYREVMGKNYPVMSLIQIAGLIEQGAKVEIEATAVV